MARLATMQCKCNASRCSQFESRTKDATPASVRSRIEACANCVLKLCYDSNLEGWCSTSRTAVIPVEFVVAVALLVAKLPGWPAWVSHVPFSKSFSRGAPAPVGAVRLVLLAVALYVSLIMAALCDQCTTDQAGQWQCCELKMNDTAKQDW